MKPHPDFYDTFAAGVLPLFDETAKKRNTEPLPTKEGKKKDKKPKRTAENEALDASEETQISYVANPLLNEPETTEPLIDFLKRNLREQATASEIYDPYKTTNES